MATKQGSIVSKVETANKYAERAFWWLKDVDTKEAKRLGVLSKINDVLTLLRTVDNITMDITISIKNKIK